MKNGKVLKTVAAIICVCLLFAFVLNLTVQVVHTHRCNTTECSVCSHIDSARKLIGAAVCLALCALGIFFAFFMGRLGLGSLISAEVITPVLLKVKITS